MAPEVAKLRCRQRGPPVSLSADDWSFLIFGVELMNGDAPNASNTAVVEAISSSSDYAAEVKSRFLVHRERFPNLCQLVDDRLHSDPASRRPTSQIVENYCFIRESTADVLDGPIQNMIHA